jgi:hypothetical protein
MEFEQPLIADNNVNIYVFLLKMLSMYIVKDFSY